MSGPLCIGILCHPTYGGSGVVASELALSLADGGHEVHLFSQEVPPRLAIAPGAVQMHRAQGIPYPLFHSTPHDLAITSAALDVHRAVGLDIVHAHYALPHAVSAFLVRSAAAADRQAKHPPPRVVTTLHGTDITLVGNDPSYAPLTHFVIGASDAVTTVSHSLREATLRQFCRGMPELCEIEVIPNFVDVERFSPQAASKGAGGKRRPRAVHVSNFRPVKRAPWLVEAFAMALEGRDAELLLVGDGPELGACRELARHRGIADRVIFLGERDAIPELLAPSDVFALASREESFGLSALEAMACGIPVVATDVGGVHEVVEHGRSGLLSELDDQPGFARNLASLLFGALDARVLGRAARERAVTHFRREEVVGRYEALYRRVLASRAP